MTMAAPPDAPAPSSSRQSISNRIRVIVLRPSIWTALISIAAYWDGTSLRGTFVYDDAGSIKNNVVVNGQQPWREAFSRDFWGTPMIEPQSHKSFRPLTTLSFKLNWMYSEWMGTLDDAKRHTFGFHVVNVVLHGLVTATVTEVAKYVLQHDVTASMLTGLLFGLHPVHAEAVSNMTSRGELLMSLLALLSFWSFASVTGRNVQRWRSVLAVYVVPWACMTLSMFCKEQGATALMTLVVYDFVRHFDSVPEVFRLLVSRPSATNESGGVGSARARPFVTRTIVLACQTLACCGWRYYLNGESSPDFIRDQNPAGFAEDRWTRMLSVSWVYCLYVRDMILPIWLCPDWSGKSIQLVTTLSDPRAWCVLALWVVAAAATGSLLTGWPSRWAWRKPVLLSFWGFIFAPFLLSSNLLVVIGLMKADRVIYFPLLGFCLMEALLIRAVVQRASSNPPRLLVLLAIMLQLGFYCAKTHERNVAWSHSLNLWMSAYRINPVSHHTIYNCGYELSLARRYDEAEVVLRAIADPRTESASNTFVYCMVLYNLKRCAEARPLLKFAQHVIEDKRRAPSLRDTPKALNRIASNLLVAQAYCVENDDLRLSGKLMYEAVQMDQSNQYAIDQAQLMMRRLQQANLLPPQSSNPNLQQVIT